MPKFAVAMLAALVATSPALAATSSVSVTVPATADVLIAGQKKVPKQLVGSGGTLPPSVTVMHGAKCAAISAVTGSQTAGCASPEGCVTTDLNEAEGTHWNDADGNFAYPQTSSSTGYNAISGIKVPGAGTLDAVFTKKGVPAGTAPAALDFTTGAGAAYTQIAPLLNQTFFVGDGLTGDNTGTTQYITVPTGAALIYLGINDACGFDGRPGCYFDNVGAYSATVTFTTAACPAGSFLPHSP
jgi:hypothetical protein